MNIRDIKTVGELVQAINLLQPHPDTPLAVGSPWEKEPGGIAQCELLEDGKALRLMLP